MSREHAATSTLGQLVAIARERRPDDGVLPEFLQHYYRHLPEEDAEERRLDDIYAAAMAHLRLGRRRSPGEVLVEVLSPDFERDGWHTDHSILLFVTADIPFLVDTVRLVLDKYGLGIHLLVHPMLKVVRDGEHRIESVAASGGTGVDVEAWTQIELDRCPPEQRAALESDVYAAIADVQRVVDDFDPMRDRLASIADGDSLLGWLTDPHFVFLGAASYRRDGTDLQLIPGTELGIYRDLGTLDPSVIDPPSVAGPAKITITRTEAVTSIHRRSRLTCLAIRPPDDGVEHRFVGLLGSGAYRDSVFAIPRIADRAEEVLELVGSSVRSHTGRAAKNTIETLPRDVVFELDSERLATLVIGIVGLQERRIVRVFHVAEPVGPWTTVFVHVPRARFSSGLTDLVADLVAEHYGGDVRDVETLLGTSSLARISMSARRTRDVDLDRLADLIDEATRTWDERAASALVESLGEVEGRRVFELIRRAVPTDYQARVRPESAVGDLTNVARLLELGDDELGASGVAIVTSIGRSLDDEDDVIRFRVFLRGRSATMAELVPVLDHLGMRALEERPSEFVCSLATVYLYDIDVRVDAGRIADEQYREVQSTFAGLVEGTIEADGLNRLVIAAGLNRRQVAVLRLYTRYLHQAGFTFTPAYIERSLITHPRIAKSLIDLFDAKFDPDRFSDDATRVAAMDRIRADLAEQLDAVPLLDDDRICRSFLTLIDATMRTSCFQPVDEIAAKILPAKVPFLPEPRPMFEIFVCSPWVEGVHLRGGRIARGGLRWSDRPEDFRTEVLGLVKAQMVKNAVIVPVGAKGGFVVKNASADPADRDAVRAEGVDRYERFIAALLSITDDVTAAEVVPPDRCVVHDEPDPYLVVAADKGTATFSDIANRIAVETGFWLGDAFASGGSNGYDHKAMGITARGAWESVRRHAQVIGKNADLDELTVVGIGDMSGDVFGNGMLLSQHLRLVAAFDHRHVFLDPDPVPEVAHAERTRLFALPRSSWADYDASLISPGGGVHARSLKSIPITEQVRRVLDLDTSVDSMRPDDLISAILRAPVDLLWNGGIGTYVKATSETHEDVGDRANDSVRVDASELRCRIVGEGGNLGLTQLGRVEFGELGGLIHTDAIDNSAGVDCSDHEVNIKIALDQLVRAGELTVKQRNELLDGMTDDVADLVLQNNRAQTLALMLARRQALPMVNVHARYLDALEADGEIDRALEYLPSDKTLAERQSSGHGLVTPEFAVLIAYTKSVGAEEILDSDLPDDPSLDADLLAYFPAALRTRFPDELRAHRLRREIVATQLVNSMVNLSGISFDHRMIEGSGASLADVARAFVAARNILGFAEIWLEVDELTDVPLDVRLDLLLDSRRMAERASTWLLRSRRPPLDIAETVDSFGPALRRLADGLDELTVGEVRVRIDELRERRASAGVPIALAASAARWPWLHTGFDMVEVARDQACAVDDVARSYWRIFEAFDLAWLWDGIGALPRSNRWQTQARASMRDDLMTVLATMTRDVLASAEGDPDAWISVNERAVARAMSIHTEIRRAEGFDLTTLSVALRQLRNLTLTAAPNAPS